MHLTSSSLLRSLAGVAVVSSLIAGCTVRVRGRAAVAGTGQGGAPAPAPAPAPPPATYETPGGPILIAGTPVVRVGVNFEDQRGGDRDYNDAVMCFQGRFRVEGSNVVSTEAQDVVAQTSSISACRHLVRVELVHPDGTRSVPVTFESNSGAQVPMRFQVGSRLEVSVRTVSGGCHSDEMSMHDRNDAEVLLDRCNTTGQ